MTEKLNLSNRQDEAVRPCGSADLKQLPCQERQEFVECKSY